MFYFVAGLPGSFASWCERTAAALVGQYRSPAELLRAETLQEVALAAIGAGLSHAVVSSRHPGGRLRAALAESRRNFIITVDDPRAVLMELVLDQGLDMPAAVQQLASSCAAISEFAVVPGALVLQVGAVRSWQFETAAAIARHWRIAIDGAELRRLIRDIDLAGPEQRHDADAWWNNLPTGHRELATGALAAFLERHADERPMSFTWTGDLFFLADRPSERASGPIDITGRARCLIQGPDIVLPPGSWSLSLNALFAVGAEEHEFSVEIAADTALAAGVIAPQREGSAELSLGFTVDPAIEHPLAIRISSQRAAFDGVIAISRATLVRTSPATAAAVD